MSLKFRHIALIGKHHSAFNSAPPVQGQQVLTWLTQWLGQLGAEVYLAQQLGLDAAPTLNVNEIGAQCDLALVVGGDGTMLGFGRQMAAFGVPLIGINQGRLGFITDIALDQLEAKLAPMLKGEYAEDHRVMVHAEVWRADECVLQAEALNDVVVNRGATAGMVELRVSVDGHFVANQRADGLIIATPTGSTAYSLSAGGPLLQPSLGGLLMVPIAPHTLSNRPLVLADPAQIVIELVAGRDASANFDMQSLASLAIGDQVKVRKSQHHAVFLHPRGWSYFDTLRQKLHWNEGGS
jgi:NAD+ kinase